MSYQETSREAYDSVLETLGARQVAVYHTLKMKGPFTDKELAKEIGWDINCVTPRRGELVERKLVEQKGFKVIGKRRAIVWGVI